MSFAEDFGHNIPSDDWNGGSSRYRSNSKRNQYSSYEYYAREIARNINKSVEELVTQTDKAYLFRFKEGKTWFPKSQVKFNESSKTIIIPEWLWVARKYITENG